MEELWVWGIKCWDITTVYWRMFSLNNAWLRIKVSLSGADSDSDFISTQGWRNGDADNITPLYLVVTILNSPAA